MKSRRKWAIDKYPYMGTASSARFGVLLSLFISEYAARWSDCASERTDLRRT